eukprot:662715-Amphidinium_carterae.1
MNRLQFVPTPTTTVPGLAKYLQQQHQHPQPSPTVYMQRSCALDNAFVNVSRSEGEAEFSHT